MEKGEQLFEITNGESLVKIGLSKAKEVKQKAIHDWDKNYIRAIVNFKSDRFQGKLETQFMTIDFEKFKRDLEQIYRNHYGTATFESLENHLELKISGEEKGYFSIECMKNETGKTHRLKFELPFNKIQILSLIKQLEKITEAFPIIGKEFRITNNVLRSNKRQYASSVDLSINQYQYDLAMAK